MNSLGFRSILVRNEVDDWSVRFLQAGFLFEYGVYD